MSFKHFFTESGKALKKLDIQVSRLNKPEFLEIEHKLGGVLSQAGLKIQKWQMGSAGSWSKSHPYYTENSLKSEAGDVDVMIDLDDLQQAFPPVPVQRTREVKPETLKKELIESSKQQLSDYLTQNGFSNNGVSLSLNYEINGKNIQVDLIVKQDAESTIHGHTLDYSQDVGMRGSDVWLNIYPNLIRLIPSPISGKTTTNEIDRLTGLPKGALQLSPDKGVVDRETGKVLFPWSQKDKISQLLLGPEATARDMSSISGMKKILLNRI